MTRKPDLADPKQAWGRCLIESKALAERLGRSEGRVLYVRVTGRTYPGREHWAVFLPDPDAGEDDTQGRVVDPTCRQFDAGAPARFDGDLNGWLDSAVEWLRDDLVVQAHEPDGDLDSPLWTDTWSRDEIEPGTLVYPWEADKADAGHTQTRIDMGS